MRRPWLGIGLEEAAGFAHPEGASAASPEDIPQYIAEADCEPSLFSRSQARSRFRKTLDRVVVQQRQSVVCQFEMHRSPIARIDGDPGNDGKDWHSHWVVLNEDDACAAGLKVRDISPGVDLLPATAPMLPIALDSPGMSPILDARTAQITVPVSETESVSFDAVTAELQVNVKGEAPLLCVTDVHDVASGDLSLPGRVTLTK